MVAEATLTRYPAAALRSLVAGVFERVGLPEQDAARVAELMVEADLSGADAHGIFRLPQYVRRIRAGGMNTRPRIEVKRTAPATALVDGDNGMGHLVMSKAAETAIEMARENGVAWVGAHHSNHAGTAGLYATIPLRADMVGIYTAVANANHMPVWGSRENLLGTNPIAFAIPTLEEPPFVLDMATTVVSYGTIKKYAQRDQALPQGWMANAAGEAILDPKRAHEGFLLPIGGYKGSGLAVALGLLAGVLNGAAFGRDVVDFNADDRATTNTGHAVVALDVARFLPVERFKREVDRHLRDLRSSAGLEGGEPIRLPGERRQAMIDERTANGIPLPDALVRDLNRLADQVGATPLAT